MLKNQKFEHLLLKNFIYIFIFGLMAWSCTAKKMADQHGTSTKDSLNLDSLMLDSLSQNESFNLPKDALANIPINSRITFYEKVLIHPNFDHLKIRSTLSVDLGNPMPTLDAIIYIENNQKIWMNLSYILNIARGVVTPEGIKAYEKYNGSYIDSDFAYLNQLLNIDFINYSNFQKLLMGRTFIPIKDSQFILSHNMEGYYMISRQDQKIGIQNQDQPSRAYAISLVYSDLFDLQKVILKDKQSKDELIIEYGQWQEFQHFRMPGYVKIIIKGTKNGQILIENTKFEDLKMQTPYSVPKNYKKIELND